MFCDQCRFSDSLNQPSKVFLSSDNEVLVGELCDRFRDWKEPWQFEQDYLEIQSQTFLSVLDFLVADSPTAIADHALEEVLLVHLEQDAPFSPRALKKARSLLWWKRVLSSRELLEVLQQKRLCIHFHPIIEAKTHQIFGYECLCRGLLEDGALIPPARLFEQARTSGLLFELDRSAREAALRTAKEKIAGKHIFINFLPTAIYNPNHCLRSTVRWVEELGLDPQKIVFEVVETEQVKNVGHLCRVLNHYREQGFKIALDDVGSGYSSLLQLLALRPDFMKIDREIIAGIDHTPAKQSVMGALHQIAGDNGITVLAEGVETRAEQQYLEAQGIPLLQGFLFGKPSPDPAPKIEVT
ncbi:EAL domain-containing protein [Acanthopleuribacter pedis]|uniref:EAL domain-containing protein n=1 Tax=Acanthopleuribacter pedis TaxID=442870 RepID=A0A8J7U8T2_9BACT|nr:EAL domain-containing protein [Acanthopleuribacter pedis]MBO1322911.1 EAL domain-containing protein [Acanthopleuribacter pedis]